MVNFFSVGLSFYYSGEEMDTSSDMSFEESEEEMME